MSFSKNIVLLFSFCSIIFVSCAETEKSNLKQGWDKDNDPAILHGIVDSEGNILTPNLIYDFRQLPTSGRAFYEPWSGDYWASMNNGIAYRYQDEDAFYPVHTKESVLQLDKDSVQRLSPAEKYDIANGHYDFPLTRTEKRKTLTNPPDWEGICHGWAAAAISEKTPQHGFWITNRDGVEIFFYPEDLKALMSYIYTIDSNSFVMGKRCEKTGLEFSEIANNSNWFNSTCWDTNPGAFHVALTNVVGRSGNSIIIDRYAGQEVWNQPIAGYNLQYGTFRTLRDTPFRPRNRAVGTTHTIDVRLELVYVGENFASVDFQPNSLNPIILQYSLDLDFYGNIIGGEWYPNQRGPDFVWFGSTKPTGNAMIEYKVVRDFWNHSM